jgi:rhodanese-related sulfurtransferase
MDISQFIQQNFTYILSVFLIIFMFKNRILAQVYKLETISVENAFQVFKKKSINTTFLDVRTAWELKRDPKIKKSKFIPLSELSGRVDEIEKGGKDKKIIVVCRTGARARAAGIKLKRQGFSDVHVMRGGIMGWQRADYPLSVPKVKNSNIG